MLINDKSRLKRNVEQIGFQLALKTSKSLSWSDKFRQTVLYCRTGNREGTVSKLNSCLWNTTYCWLLYSASGCCIECTSAIPHWPHVIWFDLIRFDSFIHSFIHSLKSLWLRENVVMFLCHCAISELCVLTVIAFCYRIAPASSLFVCPVIVKPMIHVRETRAS